MLRQLPKSGDWIDPREITSVEARDRYDASDQMPRVTYLHHRNPDGICLYAAIFCDTYEEACAIRDEIAAMVNAAKAADAGEG